MRGSRGGESASCLWTPLLFDMGTASRREWQHTAISCLQNMSRKIQWDSPCELHRFPYSQHAGEIESIKSLTVRVPPELLWLKLCLVDWINTVNIQCVYIQRETKAGRHITVTSYGKRVYMAHQWLLMRHGLKLLIKSSDCLMRVVRQTGCSKTTVLQHISDWYTSLFHFSPSKRKPSRFIISTIFSLCMTVTSASAASHCQLV